MAKKQSHHTTDALLGVLRSAPEGLRVSELRVALKSSVPIRTLQRQLRALSEAGVLIAQGKGPARRYRLPDAKSDVTSHAALQDEDDLPLSDEGRAILSAVRKSLIHRKPVGYQRDFLESYVPNQSFYLSQEHRHFLMTCTRNIKLYETTDEYKKTLKKNLLIDLSWNSSRLEGNTYSLLETEQLIETGDFAENKSTLEAQMILNHKAAINFLVSYAHELCFDRKTLCDIHALLSYQLLNSSQSSGRLRQMPVGIQESNYLPLGIPSVIEECFELFLNKADLIQDPFEQSFFCMVHLPYLQAFDDVNKRTSRIAMNIPFIKHDLCPISFVQLPEQIYIDGLLGVYEFNRIELLRDVFMWSYERSCLRYGLIRQQVTPPDPFVFRHQTQIAAVIAHVVHHLMGKSEAIGYIRQTASALDKKGQARWIEVIENELMALHEHNAIRYGIRSNEFKAWQAIWEGGR